MAGKQSKSGRIYGAAPIWWFDTQEAWERRQAREDYERTNRTGVFGAVDTVLNAGATVVGTGKAAAGAVGQTLNFTGWLNAHWRLAVIGLVAIVLLLKD